MLEGSLVSGQLIGEVDLAVVQIFKIGADEKHNWGLIILKAIGNWSKWIKATLLLKTSLLIKLNISVFSHLMFALVWGIGGHVALVAMV